MRKGTSLPHVPEVGKAVSFFPVPTVIGPGKSDSRNVVLSDFVDILTPGTYVVSAGSKLGWQNGDPYPVATAKIDFHPPTAEDAAARAHQLSAKPDTWEKASQNGRVLERLRDPQYLAPLRKEVEAGHPDACFGIASIPGVEATEILLQLADSPDAQTERAAMAALLRRLPVTKDGRSLHLAMLALGQPEIVRQSWPEKLDAPLLALAEKILRNAPQAHGSLKVQDPPPTDYFHLSFTSAVSAAAAIVANRGGVAQMPALMAATNRALAAPFEPRTDVHGPVNNLPDPLPALLDAIDGLRQRGWIIKPRELTSNLPLEGKAGALVFLRQLADPQVPKPEGEDWKQIVARYLRDDSPVMKVNALQAIPHPFPADWEGSVTAALKDPDLGVVVAACQAAGASGHQSFVRSLANVVASVHEPAIIPGVRDPATKAAVQLGGGTVLWEAWADRLADEDSLFDALYQLCQGTIDLPPETSGGTGNGSADRAQRFQMRDAWREFIQKHRDLLDHGQRVPRNDSSITPILTGLSFGDSPIITMHLHDGTDWPKPDISKTAPGVPGLPNAPSR
ncbi:hypothetical protein CfE428DRAFT_0992 [Chthoniobacter flavus Ellin428]|uniref:Uncharacterized protein n=1 Tax=Chthoniobacter flavus Ellin428 TaxID=497964 RepID=B4CWF5_9BACT|nr:hypothetical protein CfE428DRAFT_0992 [Chthoniobacter flavus Ellin428]